MKVLFIGGTGIISSACTHLAAQRGTDLTILHRGRRTLSPPDGVRVVTADIASAAAHDAIRHSEFDAVVQWVAFTAADVERDIALFRDRTRQFVFIGSASAYEKPPQHYRITESTPLANPYWEYARNKIACEQRLMQAHRDTGFPVTIVRPSLTYGDTNVPLAINSWRRSYTVVDRMRRGKEVMVPGDGTSLWVVTHNTDFAKGLVGLLGMKEAIGHAFHITTDEVRTWDQYYRATAEAAGVEARLIHIASDFISACLPQMTGTLIGDKSGSVVFDNGKIKRFVPTYSATTTYAEGIRRTLAWFDADPARQQIDLAADAAWDKLIGVYKEGLQRGIRALQATTY
ncbi:MAG: SDR family oxidoreductase [Acidobacteriia bacterium]|nr:SDR family oxidoreductase [Terriglobia bacterium]